GCVTLDSNDEARLARGHEIGHIEEFELRLGHTHLRTHRADLLHCESVEILPRLPNVGDAQPAALFRYPVEQTSRVWMPSLRNGAHQPDRFAVLIERCVVPVKGHFNGDCHSHFPAPSLEVAIICRLHNRRQGGTSACSWAAEAAAGLTVSAECPPLS